MASLADGLAAAEFVALLWVFLAFTVVHELEEWNINAFERRRFTGVPDHATDRSALGVIVLVSGAASVVTAAATLAGTPAAAWIFLPAVFFMVRTPASTSTGRPASAPTRPARVAPSS